LLSSLDTLVSCSWFMPRPTSYPALHSFPTRRSSDLHEVALARSDNPLIPDHLEVVTATLRRTEYLHFDSLKGSASPDQHVEIIAAVRSGDRDRAAELTRQNWTALAD